MTIKKERKRKIKQYWVCIATESGASLFKGGTALSVLKQELLLFLIFSSWPLQAHRFETLAIQNRCIADAYQMNECRNQQMNKRVTQDSCWAWVFPSVRKGWWSLDWLTWSQGRADDPSLRTSTCVEKQLWPTGIPPSSYWWLSGDWRWPRPTFAISMKTNSMDGLCHYFSLTHTSSVSPNCTLAAIRPGYRDADWWHPAPWAGE